MQETLVQIQNELNSISQKKREINASIRVVDNMFNAIEDTCAKCGLSIYNICHKPDSDLCHEYISSIYVGDLNEIEKVYSIKDVAELYITNRGLRFPVLVNDEDDILPSAQDEDVRLEILNNFDTIIENVLSALKRQRNRLSKYDLGIANTERVLKCLKKEGE